MVQTIYTPEVIPDQPFPVDNTTATPASTTPQTATQFSPTETAPRTFPQPVIAQHTIGDSIDTQSRRIKGTFKLDKSGGIQVGEYQNGVSGEIDITSNGIVAKNKNNQETLTIDGDTGDATFMGTLQAGSIIAGDGDIVMEKASNGNGRIVFYNGGISSILIGDPS